jgi:hypothetical protein
MEVQGVSYEDYKTTVLCCWECWKVYLAVHEELSISIQNLTGNMFTRSKNLCSEINDISLIYRIFID